MRIFAIFIILLLHNASFCQEVVYYQFSQDNGSLSSYITDILQDDNDLIWFSSNNGVSSFDGYRFKIINANNGLPENHIIEMYKVDDGTIWFLGESGQLSFYKQDKIIEYPYNHEILSTLNEFEIIEKSSLSFKKNEIEFNIFEKGRFRIDSLGELTKVYDLSLGRSIIDTRNDQFKYFISSQHTDLKIISDDNQSVISSPAISGNDPVLVKHKGDIIYLANRNCLFVLDNEKIDSINFGNTILSVDIDSKGHLWLGFENDGCLCYRNANVDKAPSCHELKGKNVSTVFRDRMNSLWVSSHNDGLFFISSQLFKKVSTKDGLLDNNILKLNFSNKHLWALTGNQAVARLSFPGIKNFELNTSDFSSITDIHLQNDRLWVSFKNRLSYLEGNQMVDIYQMNDKDNHGRINKINVGLENNLWLGKSNGFARLNNGKVVFESSIYGYEKLNVNKIIEEPDGSLWLACKNGLWRFKDNKLYNFHQKNDILSHHINDMLKDDKNSALWLAINGKGLVKLKGDSIWTITTEDGLLSNFVSNICAYEDDVWVGSSEGISRIPINTCKFEENIQNITNKDGLLSNEIRDIIVNDSFVFIATNKGLGYFDYTKYKPSHTFPIIKIQSLVSDGNELSSEEGEIELNYYSNNLEVKYLAVNFKSRGAVNCRYRLKGLDKDWSYTTGLLVQYPFIPSGEYLFQIEAANENNTWKGEPEEIKITILNPFWLDQWFIIFIVVIFIGIASVFYFNDISRRKRKEKVNREVNEYRQIALTRQMNPHFIFNSLNSIQHYILQNDARSSNRFLSKFSKLIRIILENSQESLISLEKELDALSLYIELEELRFKDRLLFEINIDQDIDKMRVNIPPMLLQPFVENAIWHGLMNKEDHEKGLLKINFINQKENVICIISDNGVGRKKSHEINQKKYSTHNSLGIQITQDRIDLINKIYKSNISIKYQDPINEKGESLGTIVFLTLKGTRITGNHQDFISTKKN